MCPHLAYVIEYRNFRAPDAWHSGDFYMEGERRTSRLGGFPERDEEEMYKNNDTIVFLLSRFVFYLIRQFT